MLENNHFAVDATSALCGASLPSPAHRNCDWSRVTCAACKARRPDLQLENHGSLYLVRPLTDEARQDLEENTSDEAQWFGGALVVEPRYVRDFVNVAVAHGRIFV